jgi:hypothetical protein
MRAGTTRAYSRAVRILSRQPARRPAHTGAGRLSGASSADNPIATAGRCGRPFVFGNWVMYGSRRTPL